MPDVFDQLAAQSKPQPAPTSGATVSQSSGPDVFDQLAAQHNAPKGSTPPLQTGDHGSLYNAASSILNSTSPQANTGNPTLDKVANGIDYVGDQVAGMGQGAIKGALSTAAGIGSVFNRVTGSKQPFNQDNLRDLTVAHGPGQSLGKGAEQVGEFATGEGAAGKVLGTAGKVAASGLVAGAQSGGDPLQTALGVTLPAIMSTPAAKAAGSMVSKFLGMTSGAGEGAVARAFMHPDSSGLAKVMRGEMTADDVVKNFETTVTAARDKAAATYAQRLDKISNTQVQGWPTKAGNFMSDIDYTLTNELKKFGVIQRPNGAWDFNHLTGADPNDVKDLIDTVYNWGTRGDARDMSPAGLDTLKKKIGEFADKGGSMSALGSRLYDRAKGQLNNIIPGYSQMTSEYADTQNLLRQFKSEFSVSPSGGANQGTISRKFQNLFKQTTNYKELLLNKIDGGSDLLDQVAGLHLNDVMPRGLMRHLVGAETLYGMLHAPHVTAAAIPTAAAASPRLIGETARAMGKVAASGVPVRDTIRRGLLAGTNSQ